jgi:hypothetical protein
MRTKLSLILVFAVLLTAGGCQRLNREDTYTLKPFEPLKVTYSPPAYEQKVTLTIKPVSAAVSAYLIKATDLPAVEKSLDAEKEPASNIVLAGKTTKGAAETYTIEGTVPAKVEYVLVLRSHKDTEVTVKTVGR